MATTVGEIAVDIRAKFDKLQADMEEAKTAVKSGAGEIQAITKMVGGYVAAIGLSNLTGMIDSTISAAANLKHLSEQTGATVEGLSALRGVAKLSGTDIDTVGGAMNKLSKSMVGANEDSKGAASALKALGINFNDFAKLTPDQQMLAVAKAMDGFKDGAGKSAAAMMLFGKSGAELLPFLHDLADKGELVGKVSADQAEAADKYEKQMMKLKGTIEGYIRSSLIPLLDYVDKLGPLLKAAGEIAVAYFAVFIAGPGIMTAATAALGAFQGAMVTLKLAQMEGVGLMGVLKLGISDLSSGLLEGVKSFGYFKAGAAAAMGIFALWELGKWAYDNFEIVRVVCAQLVGALQASFEYLKYGVQVMGIAIRDGFLGAVEGIGSIYAKVIDGISSGLAMLGADEASQKIKGYGDALRAATASGHNFTEEHAALKSQLDKNLTAAQANTDAMIAAAKAHGKAADGAKEQKQELTPLALAANDVANASAGMSKALTGELAKATAQLAAVRDNMDANLHAKQAEVAAKIEEDAKLSQLDEAEKQRLIAKAAAVDKVQNSVRLMTAAMNNHVEAEKAEASAQGWLTLGVANAGAYADAIIKLTTGQLANLSVTDQQKYMMDALAASVGKANEALAQQAVTMNNATAKTALSTLEFIKNGDAQTYTEGAAKRLELANSYATESFKKNAIAAADASDAIKALHDAVADMDAMTRQNEKDAAGLIGNATERSQRLLAIEVDEKQKRLDTQRGYFKTLDELSEEDLMKRTGLTKQGLADLEAAADKSQDTLNEHARLAQAKIDQVTWQPVIDSLEQGFLHGFKSIAASFKTLIVDMMYKAFAQPFVMQIIGSVAGSVGLSGMANAANAAAGGASTGSSILSQLSAGKSLLEIANGGFAALQAGIANTVQAGMYATGMSGNILTNSAFAEGAGTVGAGAAGLLGGHVVGNMISGQYGIGDHGQAVVNTGAAVGAVIGSIVPVLGTALGALIGGALGGLANRAFGHGPTEVKETGIEGTIGGGSFSGDVYANKHQDGGWFTSDKNWTDQTALSSDVQSAMNNGASAVLASVKNLAAALNLPVDQISGMTTRIKVKLTGVAADDEKAIGDALLQYQNTIVATYQNTVGPLQKAGESLYDTIQRLAVLQTVSAALNQFGGIFSTIASSSVDARESMISLAGGIDALMGKAQEFVKDYYSQGEQTGMAAKAIADQLAAVGINTGGITSKEDFRALVESMNVNTDQGRAQLNALLNIAPQFAQVSDFMKAQGLSLADVAKLAPAVAPLAPLFGAQTTAAAQQAAATVAATNTVASAVTAGTAAQVAATNAAAATIAASVTQAVNTAAATANAAAASANAAVAALSAKLDAIDSTNRLNAAQP